jgi:hypothetical protein
MKKSKFVKELERIIDMVKANTMASMDDRTFACLMSEVYKQKFTKAIMMSEDEDDEDN